MPAFYAHKHFGELVFDNLPKDLQTNLAPHKDAFILGTQGPDILFYHRPFKKNQTKDKGMQMHLRSAKSFFLTCAQKIKDDDEGIYSAKAAYVAGFICHFMLDNACHPYIFQLEDTGVAHGLIESEFDKYLKTNNGEKIYKNAAKPLTHKQGVDNAVADILEVERSEAKRAIKTMRTVNGMFSCPLKAFHAFARVFLKAMHANKFESMFLHFQNDEASMLLAPTLHQQLLGAIPTAVTQITEYFSSQASEETYRMFDKDYRGERLL